MAGYAFKVLIWIIGSALVFSLLVVLLFKTSRVATARDARGHLKKKQSLKGICLMATVMLVFVTAVLLYDYSLFGVRPVGFFTLLGANALLVMAVVFYDSFFIDFYVIGVWRPKFLKLPDTMDLNSMKEHVKKQFTVGWAYVIPLIILPALIFWAI